MKKLLLSTTCGLLFCGSSFTYADDPEGQEEAKAVATSVISVLGVADADEGKGEAKATGSIAVPLSNLSVFVASDDDEETEDGKEKKTASATVKIVKDDTITIVLDGKNYELKKNTQTNDAVKDILAIIKNVDGEGKATSVSKVLGTAVIIGPDGEKKEFKFGDGEANKEMMEDLPKEIQIRVENAMKGISKGSILGKGIMIGPDGAQKTFNLSENADFSETLKGLPEEARKKVEEAMKGIGNISIQSPGEGRAIVIGTDGAKREIKFGGVELKEGDMKVLEELPGKLRYRIQRAKKVESDDDDSSEDSVAKKLDVILKRLDKIEKQLKSMK